MSKPTNPLASYRSYSYYHVLLICDSSETGELVATETSLDKWQHPLSEESDPILGPFSPKTASNGGKYCVLINGSTDASVAITDINWNAVTAGTVVSNDKGTSNALEGSMSISEPKGILFMDMIVLCCRTLNIDSSMTTWVLKTFFVGYKDDDTHDHMTDIAPLLFNATNITGSFTEQGGQYDIEFVAITYGQARMPQFSVIGKSINMRAGDSLKSTFENLQDVINENYRANFDCVYDKVASIDPDHLITSTLRPILYKISVDAPYDDPKYKVTDQPTILKDNSNCSEPVNLSIPAGSSIEQAIHDIMAMSLEYKKESQLGAQDGHPYQYKIIPTVPTSMSESGVLKYEVVYKIIRQPVPQLVTPEDFDKPGSATAEILKRNVIEFEYIYTGHNIDILEFNMKFTQGMYYMQMATTAKSYKSPFGTSRVYTDTTKHNLLTASARSGKVIKNTPVFMDTIIKTPNIRNSVDASATIESAFNLSKVSSMDSLAVVMKIVGNPLLLNSINKSSGPSAIQNVQSTSTDTNPLPDWGNIPSYAKVRIKMPRHNDDLSLFTGASMSNPSASDDSLDYAVDFWYDGYYQIVSVVNHFEGGEFFQVLQLVAMTKLDEAFATGGVIPTGTELSIQNSCSDSTDGCTNTKNLSPVAIPEQPLLMDEYQKNQPSLADMKSINDQAKNSGDLNNVKGWSKASPEVQQAILTAANKHGVDPILMAQISSFETGGKFNADANKNTGRGAKGLYQFELPTWGQYGKGGDIYNANDNADAGARYIKQNAKDLSKKLGRAPTAGEIYLAHNQGLGGAATIIKACETGNESLIDNFTVKGKPYGLRNMMARQAHAKGSAQNACDFKAWAEAAVAGATTPSIPHVPHKITGEVATPSRTNRDVYKSQKNCEVEATITANPIKDDGCNVQQNQDQKQSLMPGGHYTVKIPSPTYAETPVVSANPSTDRPVVYPTNNTAG
jgi:hypothetical protein